MSFFWASGMSQVRDPRTGNPEYELTPAGEELYRAALTMKHDDRILAKRMKLAGQPVRVGVSGGIALFPQHGSTFDELSRHADGAMYAAKRGGRMRFMLYRGPDLDPEPVLPEAVTAS